VIENNAKTQKQDVTHANSKETSDLSCSDSRSSWQGGEEEGQDMSDTDVRISEDQNDVEDSAPIENQHRVHSEQQKLVSQ